MADAFDLLNLPPSFDIDPSRLQRAYLARAAQIHPDIAGGGGNDEEAARRSALLNEAKRTLENPERRADALLLRLGGPSREQERSLPEGFLMEIMETRMAIEEAIASGDPAERRKWEAWAEARRGEYIARVTELFNALPPPPPPPEALRGIRTELNAWRYIERLIEQLDPDYDPNRADFRTP